MNTRDTSKRDRIILFSLLGVSLVLIIFGLFNQARNRELVIVRQVEAQGQVGAGGQSTADPASGEEGAVDDQGQTVVITGDQPQKPPGVGTFFLVAAASFLGFIILMMAALTGIMLLVERIRRRRAAIEEETPPGSDGSAE